MSFFLGIRKQMKVSALPFLGVSMLVYFTYHLLNGDRGLLSWWKLQKRVYKAETTARVVSNQKIRLELKIKNTFVILGDHTASLQQTLQ